MSKETAVTTIKGLVDEMLSDHAALVPGCDLPIIAERNNTAGKIMSAMKVQLTYAILRKEMPDISFLDTAIQRKLLEKGK